MTDTAPDLTDRLQQTARLHALRMTGLLGSTPEPAFDRITRLAARLAGAPASVITLVDGDREFVKSAFGLALPLGGHCAPLSECMSGRVVHSGAPLVIDDLGAEHELTAHPMAAELGIAAYVGVPLSTEDEHVLGTLCVLDTAPHAWAPNLVDDLADLARTVGTEITLRRRLGDHARLDDALRASEQRFRELVEAAHEGIWALDAVGRSTYVNPRMASMLGYPAGEMTGRLFFDFLPPAAAFEARTRFARLQRGIAETHELAFRRRDGAELWALVSASPLHDADGLFVGAITHVSDITARRRSEQALERRDEQYRLVTDGVPVLIAYCDADERYEFVNRPYARAFGREAEAFAGLRLADVVSPDDYARSRPHLDAVLAGRAATLEYSLELPGGVRQVRTSFVPHLGDGRAVVGFFALTADITEQRALEEQLRRAQKLEVVGRLAGDVAHDFNNLLTVITANASFVRDAVPAGSAALADLDAIGATAARAAALARQLMTFSRQQALRPQPADANAIVRNVERVLRRELDASIALETVLDPTLHAVHADGGQLAQLLMNLAENARDAMGGAGGTLTIRTWNETVDAARAAAAPGLPTGEHAVVSVTDTGVGMDTDTLARAFEPFFTTKQIGRGTGLGLATAQGIVQQSGGHITAESVPGHGSTFTVHLPRHAGVTDAVAASASATATHGVGSVLLIEAEAPVRVAVRRTLERAGYAVVEFANAASAMALLSLGGVVPDLALVDVVSCGPDAGDLVARLREGRPGLAVLLICGDADPELALGGAAPDGVPVLNKPFTPESLLAAVAGVIRERRAAR